VRIALVLPGIRFACITSILGTHIRTRPDLRYEFCVIGGGIIGVATARELLHRHRGASLVLLEKEDDLARHQTGRNSGVIHAGVYYAPGSLKATLCREGARATRDYCDEHSVPYEICGKLIVATTPSDVSRLGDLADRCEANQIGIVHQSEGELREREPHITGLQALFVPSTGIVDYVGMVRAMRAEVEALGGRIVTGSEVTAIREDVDGVECVAGGIAYRANRLVACAGLQSDRVARLAGLAIDHRIVPFRGEYFRLPSSRNALIRHLIYPVPDPSMPFLGVHLTRMIDGGVTVGPNAVLGMAREGYGRFSIDVADLASTLGFPGFWKTLGRHRKAALGELRSSLSKAHYLDLCRRYCPELQLDDLGPQPAGIRAQAVLRDGTLVHDFMFSQTDRMLHVCNAPSPAATSALPIARMIGDRLLGVENAL
jgi:L-2-hydroxyglutarate oxidase